MIKNNKGFSIVESLLIMLIVAIIGGVAWYVYRANNQTTDIYNNAGSIDISAAKLKRTTTVSNNELSQYNFPREKLNILYDQTIWKNMKNSDGVIDGCGDFDSLNLQYNNFYLSFNYGTFCGKGSAPCFEEPDSGCLSESKQLDSVELMTGSVAYILAHRLSINNGKDWSYSVVMSNDVNCKDVCSIDSKNINGAGSTIGGVYDGVYSPNVDSLDSYSELAEVKAAIIVLKTVKY